MKSSKWTIGRKIGAGFGLLLLLLCIAGAFSLTGVREIVGNAQKVIAGNRLDGSLAQKEVDHLNWAKKVNALLTDRRVNALEVQLDHSQCAFGKWLYGEERKAAETFIPGLAPALKQIEAPHRKLHESAKSIKEVFVPADVTLPSLLVARKNDHLLWADKVRDALLAGDQSLEVETDPTRCALGNWLATGEAKSVYEKGDKGFREAWDGMVSEHEKLHRSATSVQKALPDSRDEAVRLFQSEVAPLLEATLAQLDALHAKSEHAIKGMVKANEIFASETQPALEQVQGLLSKIRGEARKHVMTDEHMLAAAGQTQRNVTIAACAAVLAGVLLAYLVSRNIVVALKKVIENLSTGGEQVASAAEQVSASSQSLAEGASEQASSLEESSSALEELASMTRQNAANSGLAKNHMEATQQVVQAANQSMTGLTGSMQTITAASEETSKIIKTIDEIAFQTNLLALNAAVEAARAGEAGAGFAVVADEVRNLAMRAAEAAKNTSGLIEDTLKKVGDGSSLVQKTNQAFAEVSSSVSKVGQLIAEISAASSEQAQGIDQVNTAVSEMDKITQQNAANAEESASASEELSAQSLQMKRIVDDLARMVGKSRDAGVEKRTKGDGGLLGRLSRKPVKPEAAAPEKPAPPSPVFKGIAQETPLEEELKDF